VNIHRVRLSEKITDVLVNTAAQGYKAAYKQERLGILLGRINRNSAVVEHAIIYRGGSRTRSGAGVDCERFTRRVRELSAKHRALFLGTFHSHIEIAGRVNAKMSVSDRVPFCDDPPHLVEVIVAVWGSDLCTHRTQRYVQGHVDGYRFRIAGYQMYSPYKLLPVYSDETK
jgi:hypothetical protein